MYDLWPVTIIEDRYSGTYSGAVWTAFNCYDVPSGPASDDIACSEFWAEPCMPVGKGETPNEALEDLRRSAEDWESGFRQTRL